MSLNILKYVDILSQEQHLKICENYKDIEEKLMGRQDSPLSIYQDIVDLSQNSRFINQLGELRHNILKIRVMPDHTLFIIHPTQGIQKVEADEQINNIVISLLRKAHMAYQSIMLQQTIHTTQTEQNPLAKRRNAPARTEGQLSHLQVQKSIKKGSKNRRSARSTFLLQRRFTKAQENRRKLQTQLEETILGLQEQITTQNTELEQTKAQMKSRCAEMEMQCNAQVLKIQKLEGTLAKTKKERDEKKEEIQKTHSELLEIQENNQRKRETLQEQLEVVQASHTLSLTQLGRTQENLEQMIQKNEGLSKICEARSLEIDNLEDKRGKVEVKYIRALERGDSLEMEIARHKKRLERAEGDILEQYAINRSIIEENCKLNGALLATKCELNKSELNRSLLEKECKTTREQLEKGYGLNERLRGTMLELAQTKARLAQTQRKLQGLNAQCIRKIPGMPELINACRKAESQLIKIQEDQNQVESELSEAKEKKAGTEQQLQEQIYILEQSKSEIKIIIGQIGDEIRRMQMELSRAQAKFHMIQESATTPEAQKVLQLSGEIDEAIGIFETIEELLPRHRTLAEKRSDCSQQRTISEFNRLTVALQFRLLEITTLSEELKQQKEINAKRVREIDALRSEISKDKEKLAESEQQVQEQKEQKEGIARLNKELAKEKNSHNLTQKSLERAEERCKASETKHGEDTAKLKTTTKNVKRLEKTVRNLNEKIDELNTAVIDRELHIDKLESKVSSETSDVRAALGVCHDLKKKAKTLLLENGELNGLLDQCYARERSQKKSKDGGTLDKTRVFFVPVQIDVEDTHHTHTLKTNIFESKIKNIGNCIINLITRAYPGRENDIQELRRAYEEIPKNETSFIEIMDAFANVIQIFEDDQHPQG